MDSTRDEDTVAAAVGILKPLIRKHVYQACRQVDPESPWESFNALQETFLQENLPGWHTARARWKLPEEQGALCELLGLAVSVAIKDPSLSFPAFPREVTQGALTSYVEGFELRSLLEA